MYYEILCFTIPIRDLIYVQKHALQQNAHCFMKYGSDSVRSVWFEWFN